MVTVEWEHRLRSLNDMIRIGGAIAFKSKKKLKDFATVKVANAIHEKGGLPPGPPYLVTLTRFGKGELNDDNLAAAFKHIRDGTAIAMGINDDDKRLATWITEQQVSPGYSVRIEIESRHA